MNVVFPPYPDTPTLNTMIELRPKSQLLSDFLDWLSENGIVLCKLEDDLGGYPPEQYLPIPQSFGVLLHEYFGIDSKEEEKEKLLVLEFARKMSALREELQSEHGN